MIAARSGPARGRNLSRSEQSHSHRQRHYNRTRTVTSAVENKTPWLIGIRLRGALRSDIRNYMSDVQREFFDRKRRYPHITLFGPFSARIRKQQLINIITSMSKKHTEARFSTDDFSSFDQSGWFRQGRGIIFAKVKPNESLKQLRYDIAQLLLPYTRATKYDHDDKNKFTFHITLAIGRTGDRFKNINKDLKSYKLKHVDVKPELILYYNHAPVFTYLVGHGVTTPRPRNLYAEPVVRTW